MGLERWRRDARESGTLYEFTMVGTLLVVAGLVLAQTHPAFLLLVVPGIAVLLLPAVLKWRSAWRRSRAATRRWHALVGSGFDPAVVVRARSGEGNAALGVDTKAGTLAFVTGEETVVVNVAQAKSVELVRASVSQWGEPEKVRYGVRIVRADEEGTFGLSYPSKSEALMAFETLRTVLAELVPFVDSAH
jgi:hypothetical protein